jgi:hypothetical protein
MKKILLNYCRECAFGKSTILDLVLSCQSEEHQILNPEPLKKKPLKPKS